MSQLITIPERRFILPMWNNAVRNNIIQWMWGAGSTATGYTFPDQVILTRLMVNGEITDTEAGKTFYVKVYKDAVADGVDDVFNVSTSVAALGGVNLITSPTGTKDGSFGTGNELNVKLYTDGTSTAVNNVSVILEGYWVNG